MPERIPIYMHESKGRYYYDTLLHNDYGWSDGAIVFRAYATPEPGTVPIYKHDPQKYDTYYYDRQRLNNGGWSEGTIAFYAYATPQDGTIPIYQHQAQSGQQPRYFYDTQLTNIYGWSQGVEAFYAYPADTTLADEIMNVLGVQGQGKPYNGTTYLDTHDNKFTLIDTPHWWDGSPVVDQPTAGSKQLLAAIRSTISSAETVVDITVLDEMGWEMGFPGGGFQEAISAGLRDLAKTGKRPLVRILIGIPSPVPPFETSALSRWLQATIELNNNQKLADVPFLIVIGGHRRSPASWNHSKIVAADGVRAIVGGHNFWADNYLGANPVHDVSALIEGSAVNCVQSFCSSLWISPAKMPIPLILRNGKISYLNVALTPQLTPIKNTGTTRMLSLGRLGFGVADQFNIATNASVTARVMALCRAKQTIRISQQSLYFSPGGFDFYTLWAIVKAMQAGVNVQIVVSNDVGLLDGGYEGHLGLVLQALASLYVGNRLGIYRQALPTRDNLTAWAVASLESPTEHFPLPVSREPSQAECAPYLNELNSRLSLASLYYAPNINYWQVGSKRKLAANHAKVYIIDDTHFYVGSDNFYLSGYAHGLQEFGHLIEGKTETADFIKSYWDKIWKNSGPHAVKAGYSNLGFYVPRMVPIGVAVP